MYIPFIHIYCISLLYAKTAPNFFVQCTYTTSHPFLYTYYTAPHFFVHRDKTSLLYAKTAPNFFVHIQHLTNSFIHIIQHLTSLCIDNNNSLLYAHAKSHFFVHIFNTSFFSYIYVTIVYILPLFITYLSYINIYYTGSSIPSPVRSYNQ